MDGVIAEVFDCFEAKCEAGFGAFLEALFSVTERVDSGGATSDCE